MRSRRAQHTRNRDEDDGKHTAYVPGSEGSALCRSKKNEKIKKGREGERERETNTKRKLLEVGPLPLGRVEVVNF